MMRSNGDLSSDFDRSSSRISIYNYPDHLNPFHEEDNHKRLRFWNFSKRGDDSRRRSFSIGQLRDAWSFKSFSLKKKSSTLGIQKTSESPPVMRRHLEPNAVIKRPYISSLQNLNTSTVTGPKRTSLDPYHHNRSAHQHNGLLTPQFQRNHTIRSSYSSLSSTNPFESDIESDFAEGLNASGRKSYRKKRRAPLAPPRNMANKLSSDPNEEKSKDRLTLDAEPNIDIRSLTVEIEKFVNNSTETPSTLPAEVNPLRIEENNNIEIADLKETEVNRSTLPTETVEFAKVNSKLYKKTNRSMESSDQNHIQIPCLDTKTGATETNTREISNVKDIRQSEPITEHSDVAKLNTSSNLYKKPDRSVEITIKKHLIETPIRKPRNQEISNASTSESRTTDIDVSSNLYKKPDRSVTTQKQLIEGPSQATKTSKDQDMATSESVTTNIEVTEVNSNLYTKPDRRVTIQKQLIEGPSQATKTSKDQDKATSESVTTNIEVTELSSSLYNKPDHITTIQKQDTTEISNTKDVSTSEPVIEIQASSNLYEKPERSVGITNQKHLVETPSHNSRTETTEINTRIVPTIQDLRISEPAAENVEVTKPNSSLYKKINRGIEISDQKHFNEIPKTNTSEINSSSIASLRDISISEPVTENIRIPELNGSSYRKTELNDQNNFTSITQEKVNNNNTAVRCQYMHSPLEISENPGKKMNPSEDASQQPKMKSVKEIIDSINRSQKLLKDSAAKGTTVYSTSLYTENCIGPISEQNKRTHEVSPNISSSNSNPENNAAMQQNYFQKSKINKKVFQYRESSPTTSNLDWNPLPKPKRTNSGSTIQEMN